MLLQVRLCAVPFGLATMNKTIFLLCVLCGLLLCSNAYLLYSNHEFAKQHLVDQAMQLPALGAPIVPIPVRGTQGAEHPLVYSPDARHAHLLLVMSPDCPYCQKNWPMWEKLVSGLATEVDVTYFDVTGKFDKQVSKAHDIRDDQLITSSLDSALKARITGTPTTVLIADSGAVKHVWQGVLDQKEVDDILAMSRQN